MIRRLVAMASLLLLVGGLIALLVPISPRHGSTVALPSCGSALFANDAANHTKFDAIQEVCAADRAARRGDALLWVALGALGLLGVAASLFPRPLEQWTRTSTDSPA